MKLSQSTDRSFGTFSWFLASANSQENSEEWNENILPTLTKTSNSFFKQVASRKTCELIGLYFGKVNSFDMRSCLWFEKAEFGTVLVKCSYLWEQHQNFIARRELLGEKVGIRLCFVPVGLVRLASLPIPQFPARPAFFSSPIRQLRYSHVQLCSLLH